MLHLPKEWQRLNASSLVRSLYDQIESVAKRIVFARLTIRAALDQMVLALNCAHGSPLKIEELSSLRWRINDFTFAYFPEANDKTLSDCADIGAGLARYYVLVPPGFGNVFRYALEATFPTLCPTIYALDQYMSWRMMIDSAQLGWSYERTFMHLLGDYNVKVAAGGHSRELKVIRARGRHRV